MRKLIIFICAMMLLTSCGMTQKELIDYNMKQKKHCDDLGVSYRISNTNGKINCNNYKNDGVMDCIKEYTNGLDEKYNNPDHVTNLREDNYSQVVKTCNEVFGEKDNLKTNHETIRKN